ncbi:MAG: 6-hydroxymethyl-7,8-dihydropterin pyrophosphokinase [Promethearchaeota archaeon]|nr:MAG: 6-hydroxymethyl-7,8-dihydropterin pyrophosphokinase [Candidatus Lokiarchaeota archaeon]
MDIEPIREKLNFYKKFKPWYRKIIEQFNYEYEEDVNARDKLIDILEEKGSAWNSERVLRIFHEKVHQKENILILGCGPSLEASLQTIIDIKGRAFFNHFNVLAADGASVLARKERIPLLGIFSDLDGISKKEFNYADFVIIHAHGDNREKLYYFKQQIIKKQNIIATTQVRPKNSVYNPGGFTDGDRILYFISHLIDPSQRLFLIGMDFNEVVGKYSKPHNQENYTASPIKKKKLKIAVKLIEDLIKIIPNQLFFVNSKTSSEQFIYYNLETFYEVIS